MEQANMVNDTDNAEKNVNTVAEFVACVLRLQKELSSDERVSFFRGADSVGYDLQPALFRQENDKLRLKEDVIFREMIASNPSDFSDDRSTFDKLVRMQHYELPTRLLDITSNPLIALFFACNKIDNGKVCKACKDGEVIIVGVKEREIFYFDNDTTSVIANLARLEDSAKNDVAAHAKRSSNKKVIFNQNKHVLRLHHFIREEKPYFQPNILPTDINRIICVKSKMSNLRISSQAGAFLLFGHEAKLDKKQKTDQSFAFRRILIANSRKGEIREELDLLGINESTVFPQMENSAKYIRSKFSKHANAITT